MEFRILCEYPNYEIYEDGTVIRKEHKLKYSLKRREVKATNMKNGYKRVVIHDKNGTKHHFYLHRLVWMAFNGEIPQGIEIDHLNGDRSNCSLSNIRAVSHQANCSNPISIERYKCANAPSKGKIHPQSMIDGRCKRSDEDICKEYMELCKQGKCGVWRLMNEAHCGYGRAVRIVKMMEGDNS